MRAAEVRAEVMEAGARAAAVMVVAAMAVERVP